MKILVTGGAGFIGSHLCDRLIKAGHVVVAADNMVLGRHANLAQLEDKDRFRLVEMDVSNLPDLNRLMGDGVFDCVFHFAANSDIAQSFQDPGIDLNATFLTTYSVLEAMRKNGVSNIVFASTSAIYGEAPGKIPEDFGPLFPISHYGAAKLASEAFISSYAENYDLRAWITRFPNVVGGRATHGAVFDFANKLRKTPDRLDVLGDGSQVKPYLHVSDLLDAIFLCWENSVDKLNYFNIAGVTRCTVKRMAEIVVEESGLNAEIRYSGGDRGWVGDVPSVDYDIEKIRVLGWSPLLDSEAAVREAARAIFRTSS